MQGYQTMDQFVKDFKMYRIVRRIDTGRQGETMTQFFLKRIKEKMAIASSRFKKAVKHAGYSFYDLQLIATHDSMAQIQSLDQFVREYSKYSYAGFSQYKKILKSKAFMQGRLKRLHA